MSRPNKKTAPYIGITGFMSLSEITKLLYHFTRMGGIADTLGSYLLMVGVLVSSKTLAGGENKWPGRYPTMKALPDLFGMFSDPYRLNAIHFASDDHYRLPTDVRKIMKLCGRHVDAIQLNMCWPSPNILERIRNEWPDLRIILQVGRRSLDTAPEDLDEFKELLRTYVGVVDDLLFDASGGRGNAIVLDWAEEFVQLVPEGLRCGVAGGLEARTVCDLLPFFMSYGIRSIDAEGRLRSHATAGDRLLLPEACAYLDSAQDLMREAERSVGPPLP